jgi:hypothetical protein
MYSQNGNSGVKSPQNTLEALARDKFSCEDCISGRLDNQSAANLTKEFVMKIWNAVVLLLLKLESIHWLPPIHMGRSHTYPTALVQPHVGEVSYKCGLHIFPHPERPSRCQDDAEFGMENQDMDPWMSVQDS